MRNVSKLQRPIKSGDNFSNVVLIPCVLTLTCRIEERLKAYITYYGTEVCL